MKCPKCGYPQYCGCCKTCRDRIPKGIKSQIVCNDGEGYICPNCGFTASCDQWLDIETEQIREHDGPSTIKRTIVDTGRRMF